MYSRHKDAVMDFTIGVRGGVDANKAGTELYFNKKLAPFNNNSHEQRDHLIFGSIHKQATETELLNMRPRRNSVFDPRNVNHVQRLPLGQAYLHENA